jgi:hypothetical protein
VPERRRARVSRREKAVFPDATVGVDAGRTREQPTTSTVEDRTARERDEWRRAGEVATGLERARGALALAAARSRHEAAEGRS